MNDDLHLLVTLVDDDHTLFRVALCIEHGLNKYDMTYPMERRTDFARLLPRHIRSAGTICAIEPILSVVTVQAEDAVREGS